MTEKTFRITWDQSIRHESYIEAIDRDHALQVWGTGITPTDSWDLHTTDPIIMEA